ncbi:MAG TPA: polyphosphate:AMP phosphotransferase [Phycisphaerae bacterium]|nr:polyphosphate:AMP phosphotransferase [Phycisphaerae bacterium]HUU23773.1 polyphosphate:AMP phosphotransferase [Phycisphaerae bacterium]
MLENIDLSRKISKAEYKEAKDATALKLAALQRRVTELGIPVIIVFEGWSAAGKGTLINDLILPLDPRGFTVHSTLPPNEEEALRPFLWRFWVNTPAKGRQAIFDRSWYWRVLQGRVNGKVKGKQLQRAFDDIRSFERQLADDGNVILKFFLHISKKAQKRRFSKLRGNPATAWRVTKNDVRAHGQYDDYLQATEEMLAETDSDVAPWTVIESEDHRFASLKIFNTVINALEHRVAQVQQERESQATPAPATATMPAELNSAILDGVDLSLSLEREDYQQKLKAKQRRLRELEHQIYMRRIPVLIVYQGWDAAGKGGNIRRLTQNLDPRGYEVVPIAAPNDLEKSHHYLWRFWMQMPKAGHIAIFDRSWYGRVMVERVEGFCTEAEWKRAYREINEMEQHMTNFGTVLLKFWLNIDMDEQLRRFEARQQTPYKQWKITEEDWRNREKWDQYKVAIEEMLFRTSTPCAPWTIVESNCKWYARVKVLDTVCEAIEKRLRE